ncbi:MAG: hypothetical protein IPK60_17690 [Sandaracinaceae bacterium]|nr:hypothetical protein [Sandaracinaceae bacterium]
MAKWGQFAFVVFVLALSGCANLFKVDVPDGSVPDAGTPYGGACTDSTSCRVGLVCAAGQCTTSGTGTEGSLCQLTGDCGAGLFCNSQRVCATAGESGVGEACDGTADCEAGLNCVVFGFYGGCAASGTGDVGGTCTSGADCLAGLSCLPSPAGGSACLSPPPSSVAIPSIPFWAGESCTEDLGAPRAYFDVPRGVAADGDFYRLPYPNDARLTATGLNLANHPHPGTVLPVDIIDRYLRASEEDLHGFSTNPRIFFRFSSRYNWDAVGGAITLVDITPSSPTYGQATGLSWLTQSGMLTRYICPNWFAMQPPHGAPLRPGTTYAAIVSTSLVPADGGSFQTSPDFAAMMAATAPSDTALTAAYAAYAPLRAYLASVSRDPSTVLNATVFTTQNVENVVQRAREVIRSSAAPTVSDLTLCDTGVTSPCDDGTPERSCGAADPNFYEIHGRIALPIFQQGTAPYETPEQGGGVMLDGSGNPVVARTENVCFALTIPKVAAMPSSGWPLMLHGHGTGGSFRGAARGNLATNVTIGADVTSPAATLTIDLPEHGARRGESTRSSEQLFYNFANPRAARDNVTQGAIDLMSLVYFATSHASTAVTLPTVGDTMFDPTRVTLFAHSQGATHASLMMPFETELFAVVLSGDGGDLTRSLLSKSKPVDIAGILPFALLDADNEGNLAGGEWHPVLAIFQQYFDSVDPVNYARHFRNEPVGTDTGRHVFMTYGLGDTYSPEPTLQALANAGNFEQVTPLLTSSFGLYEVAPPISGNVTINGVARTYALRQYMPNSGDDGHFVSTSTDAGIADTMRFMRQAHAGLTPQIGM